MGKPLLLGINIDHVATLRQARRLSYPDVTEAARVAKAAGADGITLHLREDRRHIQDHDVDSIARLYLDCMNFEMAVTEEMLALAERMKPAHACFVPEKREELTTEGGLNLLGQEDRIARAVKRLQDKGIAVSLFIDPDIAQIEAAERCGASTIELHTGNYAEAENNTIQELELLRLETAAHFAHEKGFIVNAGHGLHYENTLAVARISVLHELNIGHSIVARAIFVGFFEAVREMKAILTAARNA